MPVNKGRRVTHDLRVFSCEVVGEKELHIALHGGPTNACGSVKFTFKDPEALANKHEMVKEWERGQTPVALVTDTDEVRVIREDALVDDGQD